MRRVMVTVCLLVAIFRRACRRFQLARGTRLIRLIQTIERWN